MSFGNKVEKLKEKIEREREHRKQSHINRSGGYLFINAEKKDHKENNLKQKLDFLRRLLDLINNGATGFELAYEVEKIQEIKQLIYDGILFYNTFLEIGNKKFIDFPDKQIKNYTSFKTVEDTEKYIFMIWLKNSIASLQKEIRPKEAYEKFLEVKKAEEKMEAEKKQREQLVHCRNCGALIRDKKQEYCEECGINLMKQIN
ncbi:MAG: hypothetical protein ACFFE5_03400 [Candidatus Thorarchaeota archaeon]